MCVNAGAVDESEAIKLSDEKFACWCRELRRLLKRSPTMGPPGAPRERAANNRLAKVRRRREDYLRRIRR